MHNYRKNPRHTQRGAMDGVLHNAPGRGQQDDAWHAGKAGDVGRFQTPSGNLDDFKRPEGFHPSARPQTTIDHQIAETAEEHKAAAKAGQGASLLHMTLPGSGGAGDSKRSRRKNKHKPVKKGKWYTFRKWAKRTALVTAGLVVLLGGYLFIKGYFNLQKIFKGGGNAAALQENVSPDLLKGEGDGRVNVLLLGRGGEGHAGADLTDTILLASIDPVNKTAALVSIPRDFWYTTSSGSSSKINAVYANAKNKALRTDKDKAKAEAAGVKAIQEAVGKVLNVPVHYYAMVDFAGFKQAVDIVGGVDINVPADLAVSERLWDSTTGKPYYLNVPAGQQHFDSTKALYFTRSRHTSKRGDFDRAERQRLFITALSQKILSAGTYTNPVKISQLFDAFGSHVATDFSVGDALRLMEISKGINGSAVASIGLADPPTVLVTTGMLNGQSVVMPKAGINNYTEIQAFIRSKLQDGYILKEKAKISVLNGTSMSGFAATKSDELKSYGYNVIAIGDAPTKTYTKTIIVDLTGKKKPYTRNYLEKRFGTSAVSKLPDSTIQAGGADFVIILGSNDN